MAVIKLTILNKDKEQLQAYDGKHSFHVSGIRKEKFLACVSEDNLISYEDWYGWLSS